MKNAAPKLCDVPTGELLRMLYDTERAVGPDSASASVLRQELERRGERGREATNGKLPATKR